MMPRSATRAGRVLLLVDLSYQTYRATSAFRNLRSLEGEFTGGLFGFMATVSKIIRDCGADRVVVCEDVKPYKRSITYPEYKQIRKASQDEELKALYLTSIQQVKDMLRVVGIPIMAHPGFESDDCIGHVVRLHRHRWREIYAASNDSDLYQLFGCPWFKVWRKDRDNVMDYWELKKETGLDPEQFMLASALMGTHNDIAGIKGVGEKTACKAVLEPGLLRKYMDGHQAMIERNLALIKLPHADFPRDVQVPGPTRPFDHRELYRWSVRYDINVTTSMVNAFEQVNPT